MKITCIGIGYVGLTTAACLASLGHEVFGVDVDECKIKILKEGNIPFHEPGLKELVKKNGEKGRLRFTTNLAEAVHFGEVLFSCVNTPSNEDGSADLRTVFAVAQTIGEHIQEYKVIVNKSTVPPGTARRITATIAENITLPVQFDVVANPEFLKQGNAVYDFNHPDKIVIGAQSEKSFQTMRKVYHGLIKTYIPFLEMDWETAEMTKYANNAFLATKISYINEIANICERVGADVKLVAKAIGMDQRIGARFLNAGIGYGGSCFPKDVKALVAVAQEKKYTADLLQGVEAVNKKQKEIFIFPLLEKLREIQGDTVTLWGLSFKPKTSDLREAPAVVLISKLLQQGIKVKVYDPVAVEEARRIFGEAISYCLSIEESVVQSDALILVTEWDEFRNVNFAELGKTMKHKIIFDGRNIYDPDSVREEGFEYYGVGRK